MNEQKFSSLKKSCDKLKDIIENTNTTRTITPEQSQKIVQIKKDLVVETAKIIGEDIKEEKLDMIDKVNSLTSQTKKLLKYLQK